MELDTSSVILIVTGAHLKAEAFDRASAYLLRERMTAWLRSRGLPAGAASVVVCTDIWYLNNDDLRDRPVVSIGAPGINALTAFLADKLPSALAVDGVLMVQADLEWDDVVVACWGVDHERTAAAVTAFIERDLDAFMQAATA
jgi:hypothetical protein